MHSSRMRTVRNSSHLLFGGLGLHYPPRPPQQAPPGADPPPEQAPPGAGTPLATCCKACWDTHLQCMLG